ncbi:hypothetical protein DFH07DRAFT_1023786 [Mycena maculata]|uniref:Knr4/Smi1-like domain-containing protein n=1 Tax=Mycena maculata TaxID=230809 RepID=A0AAD7JCG5_9AGAR|nr:hypothetical protein DFH07DRAFT_1023786 [Mycena maculata]
MSLRELERVDQPRGVIFVPGAVDLQIQFSDQFIQHLTTFVVERHHDIVAVDSSILAIINIRTEVVMRLEEHIRECAFAIPESQPEQKPAEYVIWHHSPVVYDSTSIGISIWTVSNGSPENLRSLAVLLRDALRIDGPNGRFNLYPPLGPVTYIDQDYNQIELACSEIKEEKKLTGWSFTVMYGTAARLAAQGFLQAGTSIISSLLAAFPKCMDVRYYESVRWMFEFLWEAGGNRPEGLPWEAPSLEMLQEKALERRNGRLPATPEEKSYALEVIDVKISLGDLPRYPYSLLMAAVLCMESGDIERARKYMELECKYILLNKRVDEWGLLAECRILAPIILEGDLGKTMGQTAEGAKRDAEAIISAFRSWPTREERIREAREANARTPLSTSALLDILEPFKADDDASLRKPPTTEESITEVEARLGLSLPEDYREFLRTSNGMNFIARLELPGLRPVEELAWEEASALGLEELEVTLGMKVKDGESELLPKMGRLLMISDADDEEQVWLLEPSQVEKALQVFKTERGLTRFSQPVGWRVVLWRHWCPEPKWYRSFQGYLEAATVVAKKSS